MEVIFGKLWLLTFEFIILGPMLYKILSEDPRILTTRVLSIFSVFGLSITGTLSFSTFFFDIPFLNGHVMVCIYQIMVLCAFVCVFYLVLNELKEKYLRFTVSYDWMYFIPSVFEAALLVFLTIYIFLNGHNDTIDFTASLSLYFFVNFYILLGAWICYKTYLFNLDYDIKFLARKHFIYFLVLSLVLFIQQMVFTEVSFSTSLTIFLLFNYMTRNRTLISMDALSGINNRVSFNKYINNVFVSREHSSAYLTFIDIDKFKHINDTYGHIEGDAAISLVGKTLKSIAGETNSYVARIGGDEFVMVIHTDDEEEVERILNSISYELQERLIFSDKLYEVNLSFGYVFISPDEHNIKALMEKADSKMYAHKHGKKTHQTDDDLNGVFDG